MSIEIERKFLVLNDSFKSENYKKSYIKQGFLNSNKNRVVRIRILDDTGFITVKGISSKDGTSRFEWERKILLKEAQKLLTLCEEGIIEKNRYFIKVDNFIYEIDVFEGENKGLTVAEIELNTVFEKFEKPHWIGKEVTGLTKYYNSELSKHPFSKWS
jgi:CYTH domain-containing protein